MKNLIIILICLLSFETYAQMNWPVPPSTSQHNIAGTTGEYRNTSRFHLGTDITNGNNYNVHAIEAGTLSYISDGTNSYIKVSNVNGEILYIHTNLASGLNLNGDNVIAGQLIGTMITQSSIHLHLQNSNYNFLSQHLYPFVDNVAPTIHSVKFRQNGFNLNNTTPSFTNQVNISGQSHTLVYNKIDIDARVSSPGIASNGDANGNTVAPYSVSYEIRDYANTSVDGNPVENINFEQIPNNAAADEVFGQGTTFSPAVYYYILTSHPRTTPFNRYWNTALRKGLTETWPNNNSLDARSIDEARYADGQYSLQIIAKDIDYNASPSLVTQQTSRVLVDNFRPYVKAVKIKSGELDYNASFAWNTGTGQLDFTDNTDADKACGKLTITITTSEGMKDVSIEIPTLSFTKNLTTAKAGSDGKEWEFEVPEEKTKDTEEGPHKVLIDGHDMNDNELQGFIAKGNVPGAQLQKKKLDGTWDPATPLVKDNIHEFKLLSLKDKINVAPTPITSCEKSDGKATISVAGVTGNFEYSVDEGAYQASGTFENLKKGNHVANVKVVNGGCKFSKDFVIPETPNQVKLSVSGFGTTEFCNNANPPTITLSATATGGSGNYTFTPSQSITVSSSGPHTFTVTDEVTKCKESKSGDVVFVPIVCSRDPNDIVGPIGYGPGKMIAKSKQHSYMIRFENDPDFATAAAQIVKINHPLDNNVNPFSLRLSDFGFANMTFTVPPDRTFYSTRLNLVDSLGVVVDVTAGIDAVKREAFWIFESKDPATGLPPQIASLGFLPINDSTAKGEGFVTYLIKAASHTQTGDSIHAKASIVFDANGAIETPVIFNTIDAIAPVSRVKALPATVDTTTITLSWNGQDDMNGSGVRDYDVYVSENNAPFAIYQAGLTDTTTRFTGTRGSTYCFFTLANDNVGNQEAMKNSCEAMVKLTDGVILPIRWLYFKGQQVNRDALLSWATIMESNTRHFVVERSLNGSQFREVGTVAANGTSTVTSNYQFTDKDVASLQVPVIYYRLRQVDKDGKFTYSIVVAIPFKQDNVDLIVKAYPNPFQQTITLQILNVTATKETDHVALYTLDGKQLYSRKLIIQGNATVLLQDLPDLKQGVYLLKASINEKLFTMKMVRQ